MDRRNFLGMIIGGVAAAAATRSWPFRVFSFPSEPKIWQGRRISCDWGFGSPHILTANEAQMKAFGDLTGIRYHQSDAITGTWQNLDRSAYPFPLRNNS